MIKSLIISNFLILLLITVSFAQQNKFLPPRQIAFYDKYKFEDDKNGIEKYANALNSLGFICIFESDPEKRKAAYDEAYKKHYKFIIVPVENEISDLLKQIESQNNILILDLVELDKNGQILAIDEKLDISEPLIAFFNEYFKTNNKLNLTSNLPESKIGTINTESFNNEKSGIKKLTAIFKDDSKSKIFQQIGNSIQAFAMEKGFGVVFDSNKQIPKELETFQTQDITNDFISYYNQIYP